MGCVGRHLGAKLQPGQERLKTPLGVVICCIDGSRIKT